MSPTELPMFPLGSVLFPGALLSLHIFEPRYRAMVRHCVGGDKAFGVVLIERGSEVGGGDVRFDVGTRARIADAVELDDGRWVVILIGEDRVRVQRWLEDDPYPRAEVRPCADGPAGPVAEAKRPELEFLVRRILDQRAELASLAEFDDVVVGVPESSLEGPPEPVDLSTDPVAATWQAAALAGLGPLDSQQLLAIDGADERLELALVMLGEEAAVLAQRLAGG